MSSAEAPATPWRLYVRKVLRRDLADFVGSEGDRAAPTPRIIGFVLARFMQRSCVALLLRMAVGREDPLPISHGSGPLLLLGPERGGTPEVEDDAGSSRCCHRTIPRPRSSHVVHRQRRGRHTGRRWPLVCRRRGLPGGSPRQSLTHGGRLCLHRRQPSERRWWLWLRP